MFKHPLIRNLVILLGALLLLGGILIANLPSQEEMGNNYAFGPPLREVGFNLADPQGNPVSQATYKGKILLVFFGFVSCPDFCPTELGTIARTLDLLGADATQVQPIFISVDPERDQGQALADFTALFHPAIIGLTGTREQIDAAAKSFGAYYQKAPADPGSTNYLIDHSTVLYLVDKTGQLREFLRHGLTPEQIAARVTTLLQDSAPEIDTTSQPQPLEEE